MPICQISVFIFTSVNVHICLDNVAEQVALSVHHMQPIKQTSTHMHSCMASHTIYVHDSGTLTYFVMEKRNDRASLVCLKDMVINGLASNQSFLHKTNFAQIIQIGTNPFLDQ